MRDIGLMCVREAAQHAAQNVAGSRQRDRAVVTDPGAQRRAGNEGTRVVDEGSGAGRAGSFVYHTRPFVPGTTLRAWIGNNGAIPLARAGDILRGVLSGLAHAHEADVAHGELKPENVLLADEGVLVADTGIAGALGRPATPRNDMAAVQLLAREMLSGLKPTIGQEPLERTRSLPLWLTEWLRSRWSDAGRALAGMLPPPPSHPPAP